MLVNNSDPDWRRTRGGDFGAVANKLAFTWQLSEAHGWGLVGVHTALHLVERRRPPVLLVNNAGLGGAQVVATADPDIAERMIKVNVIALTRLTRAVLPGFVARGRGAIVNIASVLAFDTSFGGIYSGTKAYVVNFTEALRREVEGSGVVVQVVLPGATRTDFWERAGSDIDSLPKEIVMTADDLVDAALVGLARGEAVTAPALADAAKLDTFLGARQAFYGSLHADRPAARYAA